MLCVCIDIRLLDNISLTKTVTCWKTYPTVELKSPINNWFVHKLSRIEDGGGERREDNKDNSENTELEYSLIEPKDLELVNDLLVTQFFRNEPLGKALGADPETDVRPWLSRVTEPLIKQGVSTM